jgi:TRAP-type mannitol/chloroaromatic compound transport system permease small subunit
VQPSRGALGRGYRKVAHPVRIAQRFHLPADRGKLPKAARVYVRYVDAVNGFVGRIVMYLIFVMIGVMLYASFSRTMLGMPINWAMEMGQFLLAAYYLLGGGYSLQINAHVRMDLLYGRLSPRKMAFTDTITAFCLVFYLTTLLIGGISSTRYAVEYQQVNYTSWAPLLWPIKSIMTAGIFLMLLQAIAIFFKDLARVRGEEVA